MKKKARLIAYAVCTLLLCLESVGCTADELLNDIPREFSFVSDRQESMTAQAPEAEAGGGTPQAEIVRESLLMEEADDYAYRALSAAEAVWYRDMETILGCCQEKGRLSGEGLTAGLTVDNIDKIFQCVLNDHPELFYVDGYSYVRYVKESKEGIGTAIEFSGTYNVDYETALLRRREIEEAAEKILSGISPEASDYEKIKYVYDTVAASTDYDLTADDNQNIYSVFVNHRSVCQGYAKATQYLLNRLGVECTLVLGSVYTGDRHAWNLVKADGSYYYVDATWGDAFYQMEDEESGRIYDMPEINYDYLNVTTSELLRTHKIDSIVPMPECVATEANYYVREGLYFSSYDRERMREIFDSAAAMGRTDVAIKCADETCYQEILSALVEKKEIFDYMGEKGKKVAYTHNEKQLSLTFWVTND